MTIFPVRYTYKLIIYAPILYILLLYIYIGYDWYRCARIRWFFLFFIKRFRFDFPSDRRQCTHLDARPGRYASFDGVGLIKDRLHQHFFVIFHSGAIYMRVYTRTHTRTHTHTSHGNPYSPRTTIIMVIRCRIWLGTPYLKNRQTLSGSESYGIRYIYTVDR